MDILTRTPKDKQTRGYLFLYSVGFCSRSLLLCGFEYEIIAFNLQTSVINFTCKKFLVAVQSEFAGFFVGQYLDDTQIVVLFICNLKEVILV